MNVPAFKGTFCKHKYNNGKGAKNSQTFHENNGNASYSIKRNWYTTTSVALGSFGEVFLNTPFGAICVNPFPIAACYDMFLSDYLIVHLQLAHFISLT